MCIQKSLKAGPYPNFLIPTPNPTPNPTHKSHCSPVTSEDPSWSWNWWISLQSPPPGPLHPQQQVPPTHSEPCLESLRSRH
mmetsp:Transcript_24812/g.40854  ORF Transcript_24812/g.40854 Transcript_24812/m.40854 type:complete len:81 (-) Transcript_24812:1835-2077(-)